MSKSKYSKRVVIIVIISCIAYAIIDFLIFAFTGSEPIELTRCFYMVMCGELLSLAGIKKKKINTDINSTTQDPNLEPNPNQTESEGIGYEN